MKEIQEWLGHADFSTTANIYSHIDVKAKEEMGNKLANVINI
jgi:integrase